MGIPFNLLVVVETPWLLIVRLKCGSIATGGAIAQRFLMRKAHKFGHFDFFRIQRFPDGYAVITWGVAAKMNAKVRRLEKQL